MKRRDRQRADLDALRLEPLRLGRVRARSEKIARTFSSSSRRSTNSSAAVDGGSSHCRSSIAITTAALVASSADECEERGRDDAPRGWAGGVGAEKRDVEPAPLRRRQRVERLRRNRRREVGDAAEREPRLRLGRPRHENRRAARARSLDGLTPHGRLADTGFADDRERLCRSVEKRVDCLQLRLAANDPRHSQSVRREPSAGSRNREAISDRHFRGAR